MGVIKKMINYLVPSLIAKDSISEDMIWRGDIDGERKGFWPLMFSGHFGKALGKGSTDKRKEAKGQDQSCKKCRKREKRKFVSNKKCMVKFGNVNLDHQSKEIEIAKHLVSERK